MVGDWLRLHRDYFLNVIVLVAVAGAGLEMGGGGGRGRFGGGVGSTLSGGSLDLGLGGSHLGRELESDLFWVRPFTFRSSATAKMEFSSSFATYLTPFR